MVGSLPEGSRFAYRPPRFRFQLIDTLLVWTSFAVLLITLSANLLRLLTPFLDVLVLVVVDEVEVEEDNAMSSRSRTSM